MMRRRWCRLAPSSTSSRWHDNSTGQSRESGSEELGWRRSAHHRRDGLRVDRLVRPDRRGVQGRDRGAQGRAREDEDAHDSAAATAAVTHGEVPCRRAPPRRHVAASRHRGHGSWFSPTTAEGFRMVSRLRSAVSALAVACLVTGARSRACAGPADRTRQQLQVQLRAGRSAGLRGLVARILTAASPCTSVI